LVGYFLGGLSCLGREDNDDFFPEPNQAEHFFFAKKVMVLGNIQWYTIFVSKSVRLFPGVFPSREANIVTKQFYPGVFKK
jgi:hypothetical protein